MLGSPTTLPPWTWRFTQGLALTLAIEQLEEDQVLHIARQATPGEEVQRRRFEDLPEVAREELRRHGHDRAPGGDERLVVTTDGARVTVHVMVRNRETRLEA